MNLWLRKSLIDLSFSNRHSDCTFIIEAENGKQVFPCHKLIFSLSSEVFDRMLFGDYNESNTGEVFLNDVDIEVFEKVREYIYSYECEKLQQYSFDVLIKMAEFGNKYLVSSIKEDCIQELMIRRDSLPAGELLRLFQCAHTLNHKLLMDRVVWNIKTQTKSIVNHAILYEFSPDIFKAYIKAIYGKLHETERFNLVEMYLKLNGFSHVNADSSSEAGSGDAKDQQLDTGNEPTANAEQLAPSMNLNESLLQKSASNDIVTEMISLIDFEQLTPKEFYEGPGKSAFIGQSQKYEQLYKIANNNAEAHKQATESHMDTSFPGCFAENRRIVTLGGTVESESNPYTSVAKFGRTHRQRQADWENDDF